MLIISLPSRSSSSLEWEKAASEQNGMMKLGALDINLFPKKAAEHGVYGPSIRLFPAGKKSYYAEDYVGGSTERGIMQQSMEWAMGILSVFDPPPELFQLTSDEVFEKACSSNPTCIIAFVPQMLDCQLRCRISFLVSLKLAYLWFLKLEVYFDLISEHPPETTKRVPKRGMGMGMGTRSRSSQTGGGAGHRSWVSSHCRRQCERLGVLSLPR